MRIVHRLLSAALLMLACARPGAAQMIPPEADVVDLAGPRVGLTVLGNGVVKRLKQENGIDVNPVTTQFGWQFEKQFYNGGTDGPTAVTEVVVLVGGLEQGLVLSSLSWLVGVRNETSNEVRVRAEPKPGSVPLAM